MNNLQLVYFPKLAHPAGELPCNASSKEELGLRSWGEAQPHRGLTDLEEFLLWKCIPLWKQAETQLCSWACWFLRECYVFSCAFVKKPLRDKVFSLQKTSCYGLNSNYDFNDIKVIQNFYSKLETQKWGTFK